MPVPVFVFVPVAWQDPWNSNINDPPVERLRLASFVLCRSKFERSRTCERSSDLLAELIPRNRSLLLRIASRPTADIKTVALLSSLVAEIQCPAENGAFSIAPDLLRTLLPYSVRM